MTNLIEDTLLADLKATIEESRVLFGADWKPSQVLAVSEALEKLPKRDQVIAVEMISEPGIPPVEAIKIVEILAAKCPRDRKAIRDLYRSGDPEKKSLAIIRVIALPPIPPACLGLLRESIRFAQKAMEGWPTVGRDEIRSATSLLRSSLRKNEDTYQAFRKREGW